MYSRALLQNYGALYIACGGKHEIVVTNWEFGPIDLLICSLILGKLWPQFN